MQELQLVVILGIVLLAGGAIARASRAPGPVIWLAAGVVLGFIPALRAVHLAPEIMLLVFLPALLFWESLTTSLREIRAALRGIVLTSTLLVVLTAGAVAVAAHVLLGLDWAVAWVVGAALAPTDATAVAAMASGLPRRTLTVLRAESLVNDGTALVVYGIAVGVAVSDQAVTAGQIAWLTLLAYGGGIAAGAIVAWAGVLTRRHLTDPILSSVLVVVMPFTAFWLAEIIHASGVLAVVTSGLILTQVGPRIGHPRQRQLGNGFWILATWVINATLFVLIGLDANTAVRDLHSTTLVTAILGAVLIYLVLVATRFLFLLVSAYLIRALDRRPTQQARRVTNRARALSTIAGFRGAVSLAVALSVPVALADRDIIVFVTAMVVTLTLIVQGALLGRLTRWARLPDDPIDAERHNAHIRILHSALDALPQLSAELGTPEQVASQVAEDYRARLRASTVPDPDGADADADADAISRDALLDADRTLRSRLLANEHDTLIALRDQGTIDDTVLRQLQARLDIELLRLEPPENLTE